MVVTKMFICIIVYFITIPLVYAEQDSMIDDFFEQNNVCNRKISV